MPLVLQKLHFMGFFRLQQENGGLEGLVRETLSSLEISGKIQSSVFKLVISLSL